MLFRFVILLFVSIGLSGCVVWDGSKFLRVGSDEYKEFMAERDAMRAAAPAAPPASENERSGGQSSGPNGI